jgi:hypothetical protein
MHFTLSFENSSVPKIMKTSVTEKKVVLKFSYQTIIMVAETSRKGNIGTIILSILLGIITIILIALVIFIINKGKKSKPNLISQTIIEEQYPKPHAIASVQQSLTGDAIIDPNKWHYSMTLKISKFEEEQYPIVLFARGKQDKTIEDMQLIVLLSRFTNDIYIGFKKSVPNDGSNLYFSRDDPSILALSKTFCIHKVDNIPFFRYFTFDLVFDYNQNKALVYLDGEFVKQLNIIDCETALSKQNGTHVFAGYYLFSTEFSFNPASLKGWNSTEYRKLLLENRVPSGSDISKSVKSVLSNINKFMKKEQKDTIKCSLDN